MAEELRQIDNRFTQDTDGSNYYVVFCARKSENPATKPGHAFVVWGIEDAGAAMSSQKAFGFFPQEGNELKAMFTTVPGRLSAEATRKTTSELLSARIIVRTNKSAFADTQSEIDKWKTGDYNLYERNCISFARAVAQSLELQKLFIDVADFPSSYFQKLIKDAEPTYGGDWTSTDDARRFSLKIDGPEVTWTERGAGPLVKAVKTHSSSTGLQLRIERENTDDVLSYLGFASPALRAEILAKGPRPSYILLKRDGNKCVGEWHGLLVKKLANGRLDRIVQPGDGTPKLFQFARA